MNEVLLLEYFARENLTLILNFNGNMISVVSDSGTTQLLNFQNCESECSRNTCHIRNDHSPVAKQQEENIHDLSFCPRTSSIPFKSWLSWKILSPIFFLKRALGNLVLCKILYSSHIFSTKGKYPCFSLWTEKELN